MPDETTGPPADWDPLSGTPAPAYKLPSAADSPLSETGVAQDDLPAFGGVGVTRCTRDVPRHRDR